MGVTFPDEHSSLLQFGIGYGRKKFYCTGPSHFTKWFESDDDAATFKKTLTINDFGIDIYIII